MGKSQHLAQFATGIARKESFLIKAIGDIHDALIIIDGDEHLTEVRSALETALNVAQSQLSALGAPLIRYQLAEGHNGSENLG